ncbi:hypothetical protein [Neotabrizicola sp. sgz301269]|uniref:hypothetical protein n=1 Tax=Neotabrizicola sp. sgz301269 TaxID=3276282 RepID=UPI0037700A68
MIRAALAALLIAAPAAAGTLEGRLVTFTVMTWDDPAQPYLQARGKTVTVGEGVEFGLGPEGLTGGLDVVPVEVEIAPQRVEITYPIVAGQGQFYTAGFNGYVLRFETECALFAGYRLDEAFTTLPVKNADIFTDKGALYINVSGMTYGPEARLAIDLDVTDCPLS